MSAHTAAERGAASGCANGGRTIIRAISLGWALGWATAISLPDRIPVLVVQGDALNRSRLATVVCVPLTSNVKWAEAPGNVLLPARSTRLPKDSVANVSQIVTLDRALLTERVGRVSKKQLELVFGGVDIVLGR